MMKRKRTVRPGNENRLARLTGPRGIRMSAKTIAEKDLADDSQTMNLGRAFLVVLILHIVAIGGIAAFRIIENKGKQDQGDEAVASNSKEEVKGAMLTPGRPKPPMTVAPGRHLVKEGETLRSIAQMHGVSLKALAAQNGRIPDEALPAGTMLRLPTKSQEVVTHQNPPSQPIHQPLPPRTVDPPEVVQENPPQPVREERPRASGNSYAVRSGDTLYSIARKFGTSPSAIQKANRIRDPRLLRIGQRLTIP